MSSFVTKDNQIVAINSAITDIGQPHFFTVSINMDEQEKIFDDGKENEKKSKYDFNRF